MSLRILLNSVFFGHINQTNNALKIIHIFEVFKICITKKKRNNE